VNYICEKIVSKENLEIIDMAAEQWVGLIMEHIKWKHSNQNKR